jgi:hypothetical protein
LDDKLRGDPLHATPGKSPTLKRRGPPVLQVLNPGNRNALWDRIKSKTVVSARLVARLENAIGDRCLDYSNIQA